MMSILRRTRWLKDYGSALVLLLLCTYYSVVTLQSFQPITPASGQNLGRQIEKQIDANSAVVIAVRQTEQDRQFAAAIRDVIEKSGRSQQVFAAHDPRGLRTALETLGRQQISVQAIATHQAAAAWGPLRAETLQELRSQYPSLSSVKVYQPPSYTWPGFLTRGNLLNVINQNADLAIIAIGMTLVIITAGIDLSVGSLLALSGVTTAIAVQEWGGGSQAGFPAFLLCGMLGIALCTLCGAFNGVMVTAFRVPAFVVTLSMMLIARGLALIAAVHYQKVLSGGTTEGTPEAVRIESMSVSWLGNGTLLGIPNPIWLMLALYLLAHLMMTRTTLGRYIYAVGGNPEAARLSGVPVGRILILVYAICAATAGLGGVVDASRFNGGRPNAGELYELQVIAAVVVGGTSLAGGEGRIFGTLMGALIMAVIQNGMNMAGVKSYEQKVVFGLLILAAVVLDQLKSVTWRTPRWLIREE